MYSTCIYIIYSASGFYFYEFIVLHMCTCTCSSNRPVHYIYYCTCTYTCRFDLEKSLARNERLERQLSEALETQSTSTLPEHSSGEGGVTTDTGPVTSPPAGTCTSTEPAKPSSLTTDEVCCTCIIVMPEL